MLISGAPVTKSTVATPLALMSYWVVKTILWAIFCRIVLIRARARRMLAISQADLPTGVLELLALVPLSLDLYLIGIRYPFVAIMGNSWGAFISEIFGLFLYLFYASLVWLEAAKITSSSPDPWREALPQIGYRLRMILPVLVPYMLLTFLSQAGDLLGLPEVQEFLDSGQGGLFILATAIILFLVAMPRLIVKIWRCEPLAEEGLRARIEDLLRKIGIRFTDMVLWMPGKIAPCTAAVLGILPGSRYLLLTPCIIDALSEKELEAVITHEAAHVKYRHIAWYMLLVIAFSLVIYRLADYGFQWLFSSPLSIRLLVLMEQWPQSFLALAAVLPLALLMILYFRFVIGYFMRNFERQADMEVFRVHGHPWHLITALKRIAAISGIREDHPSWHHFSIAERIQFLSKAAESPELIDNQLKKIRISISVFIISAVYLYSVPALMPAHQWKDRARINLVETYFDQMLTHGKERPEWFLFMGQFFHEQKRYGRAEKAYLKVLEIDPENADAMNNLAWLYLKADDRKFYRPKDALLLALQAASLKKRAYILDTLAEAYFANGYYDKAVEAARLALRLSSVDKRAYYLKQLERFQSAAGINGDYFDFQEQNPDHLFPSPGGLNQGGHTLHL